MTFFMQQCISDVGFYSCVEDFWRSIPIALKYVLKWNAQLAWKAVPANDYF